MATNERRFLAGYKDEKDKLEAIAARTGEVLDEPEITPKTQERQKDPAELGEAVKLPDGRIKRAVIPRSRAERKAFT